MRRAICRVVALVPLLAACVQAPRGATTLEGALQQHVRAVSQQPTAPTIEIRAEQLLPNGALVLYIYATEQSGTHGNLCTQLVRHEAGGWKVAEGSCYGLTNDVTQHFAPTGLHVGTLDVHGPVYVYVGGLVGDPSVRTVTVMFDAVSQAVPVQNGGFLAVTTTPPRRVTLDARDATGRVLYHTDLVG